MRSNIHPHYHDVNFKCSCGNLITVGSTIAKDEQSIEVCSQCHPFYTGKQKLLDTGGRIHKFREKYARQKSPEATQRTGDATGA